jgi:hypothetical protein
MSENLREVGEMVTVQFACRIPEGDYLRALFNAQIMLVEQKSEKYVVRLDEWLAGRQESSDGQMRPLADVSRDYWALVARLSGQRISLSFEASSAKALWLRLETLTGEHNYFRRLNELPPAMEAQLDNLPLEKIFSSTERESG